MSIQLTSLHHTREATRRAQAHYHTSPAAKGEEDKYWGQFEETDAAIGKLLSLISGGFCVAGTNGTDDTYSSLGDPCGTDGACPLQNAQDPNSAGRCISLKDDTVVFFTADQGSDRHGYGMPNVRDQKQSTYEGGIRIPFIAWSGRADFIKGTSDGVQSHVHDIDTRFLGSQVDIFATIANLAEFTPETDGHIKIGLRQNMGLGRTLCTVNPNDSTCVERKLAGRTLLPVLTGQGITDTNKMRDMAYAVQDGRPAIVTTRTGYFCDSNSDGALQETEVASCQYASKTCSYGKVQSADLSIDRHVWGASGASSVSTPRCEACTTKDDCGLCYVQGVCVPTAVYNNAVHVRCTDDTTNQTDCVPESLRHCVNGEGCPSNYECKIADVGCDGCRPATWKLVTTGGNGALYDLTGNPEEMDRDDRYNDETLNPRDPGYPVEVAKLTVFNCASNVDLPSSDPNVQKVINVQKCLKCMRDAWFDCVTRRDHGDGLDCEDPRSWPTDPAHNISPQCVNECPSY